VSFQPVSHLERIYGFEPSLRPVYRTGAPLPLSYRTLCVGSTNMRTEFF